MLSSIPRALFNLTLLLTFVVCASAIVYIPVNPPVCDGSGYAYEFEALMDAGSLRTLFRSNSARQVTFNVATPLKEYVIT